MYAEAGQKYSRKVLIVSVSSPLDMYNMIGYCPEEILVGQAKFALRNIADASDTELMTLQHDLIRFLSDELIKLPSQSNGGIVLHSGSEANEVALLLAKRATGRRIVVASNLSHTSIMNSCQKLDMELVNMEVDRPGFQVSTDAINDVLRKHGNDIAVLSVTYGTTKLGTQQDFLLNEETAGLLEKFGIWVHVDAAYGGFMLSLLQRDVPAWKTLSTLRSVTVDTHKFVGALGCGVLLLHNQDDKKHVGAEVVYFEGNASALGTTRSAYPLATAMATVRHFGISGLYELAKNCNDKAVKVADDIEALGFDLLAPIIAGVVPIALSSFQEVEYTKSSLNKEGFKVSPVIIPFASGNLYGIRIVVTPKNTMTAATLKAFVKALKRVALELG